MEEEDSRKRASTKNTALLHSKPSDGDCLNSITSVESAWLFLFEYFVLHCRRGERLPNSAFPPWSSQEITLMQLRADSRMRARGIEYGI